MNREYTGEDCVRPDGFTFRSGVTTVVDAGSSGWRNFGVFRDEIINKSKTRVFAMLNIVGQRHGRPRWMSSRTPRIWSRSERPKSPSATATSWWESRSRTMPVPNGSPWIAAVEAGELANMPVMVDFATFRPERPFQELVLKHLRPGDIYTHTYLQAFRCSTKKGSCCPIYSKHASEGSSSTLAMAAEAFRGSQAIPAVKQGFIAGFDFDRPAYRQHERRHEGHAERDVKVPEYGHAARRGDRSVYMASGTAKSIMKSWGTLRSARLLILRFCGW